MSDAWAQEPFTGAYRVRVVEEPPTTYLRWELFRYLQWSQLGEEIVVVSPSAVARYEHTHSVPELNVIAGEVLYEILYDDRGAPAGGRRIVDPTVVTQVHDEIVSLFRAGESLHSFVERHPDYPLGRLSIV